MNFYYPFSYFLCFLCLFFSCHSDSILDQKLSDSWKRDRGACLNKRSVLIQSIKTSKEILKKSRQDQILEALGKPDKIEIYRKGQKFYIYYYETGKQCEEKKETFGRSISIRFDAIGRVNEVIID